MKHEDNKHTTVTIHDLCVFFKSSPGNKKASYIYQKILSKATYIFLIILCVPWELNPQPFMLLTQCSTTEPQEHLRSY